VDTRIFRSVSYPSVAQLSQEWLSLRCQWCVVRVSGWSLIPFLLSYGCLHLCLQIVLNMGGEMMYILQQRLAAQSIPEEKAKKGSLVWLLEWWFCESGELGEALADVTLEN
jgi:hypothetical protein